MNKRKSKKGCLNGELKRGWRTGIQKKRYWYCEDRQDEMYYRLEGRFWRRRRERIEQAEWDELFGDLGEKEALRREQIRLDCLEIDKRELEKSISKRNEEDNKPNNRRARL